jgi:hypothetical protein
MEEHRVYDNRMLRRIFGQRRNDGRKLHNKELHNLYFSPV